MTLIISRTPLRISLFGGGTDYPTWAKKNGSNIISAAINKYIYVVCRYHPEIYRSNKSRVIYKSIERVNNFSDIKHPVVRGALKYLNFKNDVGIELYYQGDLPARSGLGSSSAFSVGVINSLMNLQNIKPSKKILSKKATYLEQKILNESVGLQDQIATSYGGFNHISINKKLDFKVNKINLSKNRLEVLSKSLVLVHSGKSRIASNIARSFLSSMKSKKLELSKINDIALEAKKFLNSNPKKFDLIGDLLNETWLLKKSVNSVISNSKIDTLYNYGISNGAIGGKLLGAGSEGFMLFYVSKNNITKFNKAFSKYTISNLNFDHTGSFITKIS
jgi:D-glycero-alpha-D-manno-heptose-7-phosphate kinase